MFSGSKIGSIRKTSEYENNNTFKLFINSDDKKIKAIVKLNDNKDV